MVGLDETVAAANVSEVTRARESLDLMLASSRSSRRKDERRVRQSAESFTDIFPSTPFVSDDRSVEGERSGKNDSKD